MKLSKKKIAEIGRISVYESILKDTGFDFSFDDPPEMWNSDKKMMFDLVCGIEEKIKDAIIDTLSN